MPPHDQQPYNNAQVGGLELAMQGVRLRDRGFAKLKELTGLLDALTSGSRIFFMSSVSLSGS